MTDFRGATVEDLDLLPALSIQPSTPIGVALDLSFENSYSYLPVVSPQKQILGYLTAEQLQNSNLDPTHLVSEYYTRFNTRKRVFRKITPNTPLEQLAQFFQTGEKFAVVTDSTKRFVLGVVTQDDLNKFVLNRPAIQ